MPKTKVERNRAYRQRLRAKARAWDRLVEMMKSLGYQPGEAMVEIDALVIGGHAAALASDVQEQANGQA